MNYTEEIRQKLITRYGKLPDRCFVIGNGPSLNNMDLSYLENEITITCNSFMEGMIEKGKYFVPSILCAGDGSFLKDCIRSKFQYDDKATYHITKRKIMYIFHAGALIRNCYDVRNWTTLCPHRDTNRTYTDKCECVFTKPVDMNNFQDIMNDSGNFYLINDFDTFTLTKNINDLMFTKERADQIVKNYTHCYRYNNVIPMISLLIAREIGFKYIYLIGCDGNRFDVHFYDKFTGKTAIDTQSQEFQNRYYKGVYDGMRDMCQIISERGTKIYNCFESVYDFVSYCSFNNFIEKYKNKVFNNNDKQYIVERFHAFANSKTVLTDYYPEIISLISKNVFDQNYITTTIFGKTTGFLDLNYHIFSKNPIIVQNGIIDKILLKYHNGSVIINYLTDSNLIKNLPQMLTRQHFINNLDRIIFIINLHEYIDNDQELQNLISNNNNIYIINNLESLELTKSIDDLIDIKTCYNQYSDLDILINFCKKINMNNIYLYAFNDVIINKFNTELYPWATIVNLDNPYNNTTMTSINYNKLQTNSTKNILDRILNYQKVLKLQHNEDLKILLDAIESIITEKTDSVIHDYIYIKNRKTI